MAVAGEVLGAARAWARAAVLARGRVAAVAASGQRRAETSSHTSSSPTRTSVSSENCFPRGWASSGVARHVDLEPLDHAGSVGAG